jgi:glycine betaine catabolism B
MLKYIDDFLNSITMYKVVLYGLLVLAVLSIFFGVLELVPFSGTQLLASLVLLFASSYAFNYLLSVLFRAPTNSESAPITAVILFFIFPPAASLEDAGKLLVVCLIAMASKYVFAINRKHLFNPAAISAVISSLLGVAYATWWVGTLALAPATIIIGLLIVRKIRRFSMLFTFLVAASFSILVTSFIPGMSMPSLFFEMMASWPIFFFGTVMLTEPLTTPPTRRLQMMYGILVGLLFGSKFHFGPFFSTPETVLVVGNFFSYLVSPKQKLFLKLKQKIQLSSTLYEFVFSPDQKLQFRAGQYLEWTLPHEKPDMRGNRRYFTIASSPTEAEMKLGVKIETSHSSYKNKLQHMNAGEAIVAAQLAGDFTLPEDTQQKLVFMAGGIGITPFRSMLKYLTDQNEKRDVILLYSCSDPKEFVYQDIFDKAKQKIGAITHYVLTKTEAAPKNWKGILGRIDEEKVKQLIPDYKNRMFYLSGPSKMVDAYKEMLLSLNIDRTQIVTDYFPGF